MASVTEQRVDVIRLLGYPVRLAARQEEHLDEVTREFMLLSISRPSAREQVPHRLLELLELLSTRHAAELEGPRRQREQALQEGRDSVDLVYPATQEVREAVTGWQSMMREVDAYCRDDELLALATPAEVVRLQQWVVSEFVAQLEGHEPTPWPGA